ncbi:MAG TPA: hypothetical protein DHD79_06000 [Firmicutes bacterium]|nr:hypothetical protein [Bacillota bacterium]HAW70166.1 hypothetical protein [Bacillota bacterium]HAZ22347.1 hypothetical protein [Bacillota bacterium]HBE06191.1 hypothetical protein [Bacillota bacterium]HBG45286.1 hypothetical protein [Bacillota bacterium]
MKNTRLKRNSHLNKILIVLTLTCLVLGMTACELTPALRRTAERSINSLIAGIPLSAEDLAGSMELDYSPIPFVRLRLEITPQSLTKEAVDIDFDAFPKIRVSTKFHFSGLYRLYANDRPIISDKKIDLIGEGWINLGFEDTRFFIDDFPSIALKLADHAAECPDIDTIVREPKSVLAGETYRVSTTLNSNVPGHLAYLVFSNNKAVTPDRTVLKTSIGKAQYRYEASMLTNTGIAADNYYGNIMAVQFITANPKNLLDLSAYDVLFTTAITLVKVK